MNLVGAPTNTPTQSVAVAELILVPTETPLPLPTPAVDQYARADADSDQYPGANAHHNTCCGRDAHRGPNRNARAGTGSTGTAVRRSACSVLSSPGAGQTVSGVINITGRAVHEAFQNYKLEYAADGAGFNWFTGGTSQVEDGLLGTLDTDGLPNGAYTLQLTVVDLSANFPPPCQVTVFIQN